jgi:hypothetical protein
MMNWKRHGRNRPHLVLRYSYVICLEELRRTRKMSVRIAGAVAENRIGRLLNASNMHYYMSYLFSRYLCIPQEDSWYSFLLEAESTPGS